MSEIAKMYKNAGVELYYCTYPRYCEVFMNNKCNYDCDYSKSRFTPEKQLELIKWLCKNKGYTMLIKYINFMNSWRMECDFNGVVSEADFDECFAYLLNDRWQDLTSEEQEQIRSILNG